MESNKPTRSKKNNKKTNWFAYIIVFFSGILITIFITFPLNDHDRKEQGLQTDKIEIKNSNSEPFISEPMTPKTEELTVSESVDYPYQVDMENITANRFIFRPKGDSVGSLNKNRTVVIENTDVENKYIVSLANSYHDAYTDFSSKGTYQVKKETIPTLEIKVSSFGGDTGRDVKVNTQLTFNEQLSSVGDEFGPLIGHTMYLFHAVDGSISLALETTLQDSNYALFYEYQGFHY